MTDGRRLAGRALIAIVLRLGSSGLAFALFVVLSRAWGPTVLGEFATVFAVFVLLQQAPLMGLHIAVMREVAADFDATVASGRLASVAALGVVVALVLLPLVGGAGHFYPSSMRASLWLVGLSMVPTALIVAAEAVLMGRERLTVVMATNALESVLRVVGGVLVLVAGWGLTALWAAFLAARLAVMVSYLARRELRDAFRPTAIRMSCLRSWLRESPAFLGVLGLSSLISRLDFLLLSQLATLAAVGIYGTAYKIYEVALLVPALTAVVLFPVFSRLHAASDARLKVLATRVARLFALVGLPCALIGAFIAQPLMDMLFGSAYATSGAPALRLLIFAPLIAAIDQLLTTLMLAAQQQRNDVRVLAITVTVYAVLLVALVPTFGVVGAAAATLATGVVQLGVRFGMARRSLPSAPTPGLFVRPVAAAGAMAVALTTLPTPHPVARVAVALIVYVVALVVFRAVGRADVQAARATFTLPQGGRA